MRLVTYAEATIEHVGAVDDSGIVCLDHLAIGPTGPSMTAFLDGGDEVLAAARRAVESGDRIDPATVVLRAPVPRPGKFLGVGGNFKSHLEEVKDKGLGTPRYPVWFNKQTTCVTGPYDPILRPLGSDALDYEGEFGVVIGRRARHLSREDAMTAVVGFIVCNDVSVRDWQMRSPTSTVGKSFDTHGPVGPWITTRDEISDPASLRIRTWVNGDLRQDGTAQEMVFDCAALVSDLSQYVTLEPGDLLTLGSPAGVGGLRHPPDFLKAGDVVRVEVDGLGAIQNSVIDEPKDRFVA